MPRAEPALALRPVELLDLEEPDRLFGHVFEDGPEAFVMQSLVQLILVRLQLSNSLF